MSGLINADLYRVDRRTRILVAKPATRRSRSARYPGAERGASRCPGAPAARALDDAQVLALVEIGVRGSRGTTAARRRTSSGASTAGRSTSCRRGRSRRSTRCPRSLIGDDGLRVYLGFGHLQMMLDAMPRLALEVWRYASRQGRTGARPTQPAESSQVMFPAGEPALSSTCARVRRHRACATRARAVGHGLRGAGRRGPDAGRAPRARRGTQLGAPGGTLARLRSSAGHGRVPARCLSGTRATAARFARALEDVARAGRRARCPPPGSPRARVRRCEVRAELDFSQVGRYVPAKIAGVVAPDCSTAWPRGAGRIHEDESASCSARAARQRHHRDGPGGGRPTEQGPPPGAGGDAGSRPGPRPGRGSARSGGGALFDALDASSSATASGARARWTCRGPLARRSQLLVRVIVGRRGLRRTGAHRASTSARRPSRAKPPRRDWWPRPGAGPLGPIRRMCGEALRPAGARGWRCENIRSSCSCGCWERARTRCARLERSWSNAVCSRRSIGVAVRFEELAQALEDRAVDLRHSPTARVAELDWTGAASRRSRWRVTGDPRAMEVA